MGPRNNLCTACGHEMEERTDRFCTACGASLAHLHNIFCRCGFSAAEYPCPNPEKPFCPLCGEKIIVGTHGRSDRANSRRIEALIKENGFRAAAKALYEARHPLLFDDPAALLTIFVAATPDPDQTWRELFVCSLMCFLSSPQAFGSGMACTYNKDLSRETSAGQTPHESGSNTQSANQG